MYVGKLLFPTGGWETFGREWLTWIAVDSLICFVIVWQVVRAAEPGEVAERLCEMSTISSV